MTDSGHEILVLGPLDVRGPEGSRPVGGARAHRFLAALVLSANHAVRIDTLIDVVWGEERLADPVGSAHSMAARLRRVCGSDAIALEDHSYRLIIEPDRIDACRFERMAVEAEQADDPAATVSLARAGLELWRGPAYGDLADIDPFRLEAIRLEEIRQSLTEALVSAQLELGHTNWAIPMLRSMLNDAPYRERLWRLLMVALGRAGRRGEAAAVFDDYVTTLAGVGLEPDPAMCAELDRIRAGSG